MDWIGWLGTFALGIVGGLALSVLAPVNAWLGRRARGFVKPLFIHVVANPEQTWALNSDAPPSGHPRGETAATRGSSCVTDGPGRCFRVTNTG